MPKKVLILTGSPRKEGNSNLLAEAFARGAREEGHTVHIFDTAWKQLSGCRGCDRCWENGHACVIQDDFRFLSAALEEADVLVLAFPLYWSSMPSQLKAPIDRLYAYADESRRTALHIKESVLIACGECEGIADFTDAVHIYRGIIDFMGWKDCGQLLVPGVKAAGAVQQTDGIVRAVALGRTV